MTPYNYHWRTSTRPRILERDGYRCRRCGRAGRLDVAHLDQDNTHDDDENLLSMCRRDHRRHDYASWKAKSRETRAARKDAGRPILVMCG